MIAKFLLESTPIHNTYKIQNNLNETRKKIACGQNLEEPFPVKYSITYSVNVTGTTLSSFLYRLHSLLIA